jgi:phytoene dehydrogenase-like protein
MRTEERKPPLIIMRRSIRTTASALVSSSMLLLLGRQCHGFVGIQYNSFGTIRVAQRTMPLPQLASTNDSSQEFDQGELVPPHIAQDVVLDQVDVAIIGAGLGGLCAGAILNTLYGKKVGIYESHYLAGGCAHAFDRKSKQSGQTFTFDSGPTILLGCSSPPFNPLAQVLIAVNQNIEWIPYNAWGMIENPGQPDKELKWRLELGPNVFEDGPLQRFGGPTALQEFQALQNATKGLLAGVAIPAMAMRAGKTALIPLLRYFSTLVEIIKQGELTTSTFAPFMDGPLFEVKDEWLRNWLDALAFSLSGLPACRTSAAAMAFVLNDMHRPGASLDYPKGGFGEVVNALVRGVEQGTCGSKVHLRQHVESIDCSDDGSRITGITLRNGQKVTARDGVICNVPVWSLRNLVRDYKILNKLDTFLPDTKQQCPRQSWERSLVEDGRAAINAVRPVVDPQSQASLLATCDTAEMTGSFLHLHIAIDAKGLNIDEMEAHYTVMDRSLAGDGSPSDGPCGELNMIAVSNPCVIDKSLAPEGFMIIHAYGAGNEPFAIWEGLKRNSDEYKKLKEERAEALWRAIESVIPDARERTVEQLIGSPLTHERFLRRPRGTYGSATEDYLKDGSTPFPNLVLAGDGVFPGIGMPA